MIYSYLLTFIFLKAIVPKTATASAVRAITIGSAVVGFSSFLFSSCLISVLVPSSLLFVKVILLLLDDVVPDVFVFNSPATFVTYPVFLEVCSTV